MKSVHTKNLLTLGLLGVLSIASLASEYRSPNGYRLEYPDTWQVMTSAQLSAVSASAQNITQSRNAIHMDVMISNKWNPAQNINVIVTPGSLPIGPGSLSEAKEAVTAELNDAGIKPEGLTCKIVQVGRNKAVKAAWFTTFTKVSSRKVRQEQFILCGNNRTYIVTFTSRSGDSAAESTFNKMINSFQVQS